MKPVFQTRGDGNCVRASIASLFEIPIEKAPATQCEGHHYSTERGEFACSIPEHANPYKDWQGKDKIRYSCDNIIEQDKRIQEWASRFGLRWVRMHMDYGERETGPQSSSGYKLLPVGLCIAAGPSPRGNFDHAVVWDTRLRDFEHPYGRMVHDPQHDPEGKRPGIGRVEKFEWFDVEDPSLLHKLNDLRTA